MCVCACVYMCNYVCVYVAEGASQATPPLYETLMANFSIKIIVQNVQLYTLYLDQLL